MGRRPPPLDGALLVLSGRMRAVAHRHGGVISAADATALGADTSAVRRLISSGEWRRLRRGVYGDTVADAALARGIASADGLVEAAARHRGRPGARTARLVVERSDPLTESWFESSSR